MVQKTAKGINSFDGWYDTMSAFVGWQRRQVLLYQQVGKAKKACMTRWIYGYKCTKWMIVKEVELREVMGRMNTLNRLPSRSWYFMLIFVNYLFKCMDYTFKGLQFKNAGMARQQAAFGGLTSRLTQEFNVDGRRSGTYDDVPISGDDDHYEDPDSDMEENDSDDQPHFELDDANSPVFENSETSRTTPSSENTETAFSENEPLAGSDYEYKFIADHDFDAAFMRIDPHACDFFETDPELIEEFRRTGKKAVLQLLNGVHAIVLEVNHNGASSIPPTTPLDYIKCSSHEFNESIKQFEVRFTKAYGPTGFRALSDERNELCHRYRNEVTFKKELDRCNSYETFSDKWNSAANSFPFLLQFASGLNAIMGGSHSVESDFSLLKFTKNEQKSQMTNIALEGQMQSKQFKLLKDSLTENGYMKEKIEKQAAFYNPGDGSDSETSESY